VPWLKEYLQDRGIQVSSEGKNKRKAELVELSFNAHRMKLPKLKDGDHEERTVLLNELLKTKDGVVLPNPDKLKNWSYNLAPVPDLTIPDICNYLIGKSDYDEENLKSFKSLEGYRLFKDGHVVDMKLHDLKTEEYSYVQFKVKPTERSKTTIDSKPHYEGIVILQGNGSVHGAWCPCQGG
jgi:hypothetical protein